MRDHSGRYPSAREGSRSTAVRAKRATVNQSITQVACLCNRSRESAPPRGTASVLAGTIRLMAGTNWTTDVSDRSQCVRKTNAASPLRACFVGSTSFLLAGLLLLGTGCQPSRLAEGRVRMRTEGLHRTAATWAASEQSRPAKLNRLSAAGGAEWNQRQLRCEKTINDLEDWQQRDRQRWQERQRVYADELRRILWGHPERIERPAVIMLY